MSMRIAYVCADPGVPVFGAKGASVHVQEVLAVLLDAGHRIDLVCRRTGGEATGALAAAEAEGRLRVHRLERITGPDPGDRERRLLEADDDVRAALAAAAPAEGFDLLYERYALFSRAATRYAAARRIPAVVEVNAPLPVEHARHRGLVHVAEAEAVTRDVLRAATAVVCVSEPVAAWVREQAPEARITVEPNGVDPDRIRPAPRGGEGFTVGFVGTLKPWHGTETLLEAFAMLVRQVPRARLLLVGDGPQAGPLRAQAAELGVAGSVTFTGALAPADVPGHLARMDIAVAPYPAEDDDGPSYFSPLKVLEYMAAGLPVVASEVGQVPELVEGCGVLVPGSDARALAAALTDLAAEPERRRFLGVSARLRVLRSRTWSQVVARSLATAGVALYPEHLPERAGEEVPA